MAMKLYLDNPEIGTKFEAVKASLPGAGHEWLTELRADSMARFTETGIPGPKVEEWRYTPLGFLARESYDVAKAVDHNSEVEDLFAKAHIEAISGPVIVFVNGYVNAELSSYPNQDGVKFALLSQQPEVFRASLTANDQATPLNNLNRALVTDGYSLEIAPGTELDQPLQVIHLATSGTDMQSLRTRGQIKAGNGAKARIIETFIGVEGERYWSHMITDVTLDEGSDVALFQFQLQGKQAIHMTELHSSVATRARFSHSCLQLGAEISRTELINSFTGEYAEVSLSGAYLGRIKQSHDIFTRINHDQPNCRSSQLYRGVLDEGGKSAFQGKVVVAQDAQKTNADQSNKNLLLSRKAEANAKPELLIYADDVKCSHGATVGELDQEQLFYLRSRGLDEAGAKSLLVEAFVSEVFDALDDELLRQSFKEKAAGWLIGEATS